MLHQKKPISYLVKFFIYIVATFFLLKPVFPVVDYIINYDYISSELCENKEKPELECNGKCHLKKELAELAQDENPQSNEQKANSISFEVLFCDSIASYSFISDIIVTKKVSTLYNCIYFRLNSTSIFHPPILA